eukprot:Hpha_TRINITY_DN15983_c2_g6::TRINITY_DN15983_c2_g6_i1::g.70512::m.70512/K16264/czcD, zitB; cobalt-zinc-cadmium efflux system protein
MTGGDKIDVNAVDHEYNDDAKISAHKIHAGSQSAISGGDRSSRASRAMSGSVVRSTHGRGDNLVQKVATSVMGGDESSCCGCFWTRNAKTFFLSFVMFSTITSAQVAGALISNSNALLEDCASMALDAITYLINIVAECRPEPDVRKKQRNQLISSGLSFGFLLGVTAYFLQDAIQTLVSGDFSGDDVNAYIVFGFAVGGLVFDLICLAPYFLYGCPCVKKADEDDEDVDGTAEKMNLCSALMHVSADLIRSTTTFTESILIWAFGIDGDKCDVYATVIVSATILVGMIKPLHDWCQDLAEFCRSGDEQSDQEKGLLKDQDAE